MCIRDRSQLWQPHNRLCQLCRVCEQQRSCSPGFCRKELHATESAVEVRRARRRLREAATDERWTFHSRQRRAHSGRSGACARHSGEARDRLWRSGSRPSISVNPASTPFTALDLGATCLCYKVGSAALDLGATCLCHRICSSYLKPKTSSSYRAED